MVPRVQALLHLYPSLCEVPMKTKPSRRAIRRQLMRSGMSKRDAVKATTLGNWTALADRYKAIGKAMREMPVERLDDALADLDARDGGA